VGKDWRAPLNQVHLLFAGKLKPDDVIAAAKVGNPGTNAQSHPLFFAHYYVGLYYEAAGESQLALEHIDQAITRRPRGEYMGDIAKVHAAWLRKRSTSAPKP
jgi:lipoprotein NlpI